jgi:hypothetical protein
MKSIYTLLLLASASTVEEGAQDSNKIAANENQKDILERVCMKFWDWIC